MYVDEVGNADLGACLDPNHRFLSLTGVIVRLDTVREELTPEFDRLKRVHFPHDPDKKVIFHRKELVQHLYPFEALKDSMKRSSFNADLMAVLKRLPFVVLTAVIDKLEHKRQYEQWAAHPYHYCMEILLERYVLWLEGEGSRGDVMAEARGKKEDRELSETYTRLLAGTNFLPGSRIKTRITSSKLKLERKSENIAGLQLADLVAHPSFRAMRLAREGVPQKDDFGAEIAKLLEDEKYRRHRGRIDGYGRKWLP